MPTANHALTTLAPSAPSNTATAMMTSTPTIVATLIVTSTPTPEAIQTITFKTTSGKDVIMPEFTGNGDPAKAIADALQYVSNHSLWPKEDLSSTDWDVAGNASDNANAKLVMSLLGYDPNSPGGPFVEYAADSSHIKILCFGFSDGVLIIYQGTDNVVRNVYAAGVDARLVYNELQSQTLSIPQPQSGGLPTSTPEAPAMITFSSTSGQDVTMPEFTGNGDSKEAIADALQYVAKNAPLQKGNIMETSRGLIGSNVKKLYNSLKGIPGYQVGGLYPYMAPADGNPYISYWLDTIGSGTVVEFVGVDGSVQAVYVSVDKQTFLQSLDNNADIPTLATPTSAPDPTGTPQS